MAGLSRLLAYLYITRLHHFLGLSWSAWLRLIPFLLFLLGVVMLWPICLILLWLVLAVVLWLVYAVAGRMGYQRFIEDDGYRPDPHAVIPRPEEKVACRATGIFSLHDREDYVLEHPAEYWRVPLGQHIFMVQFRPGRYLYQVIKPEFVQTVTPGFLLFGAQPRRALAVTFYLTWGPQYSEYKLYYVGTDNAPTPEQERTVYLTFKEEAQLQRVWRSLVPQRSLQPGGEKVSK